MATSESAKRPICQVSTSLEDASDRAAKHRCTGLRRIRLDQLGFWDENRGGLGCSGHHVHEVAWDMMANKIRPERYRHVAVLRVPLSMLPHFREKNANKAAADSLMPQCAANMVYACLTKTHFTHACKLGFEGRTFFNEGKVKVAWRASDNEARAICDDGPLCAVYDASLMDDRAALEATMSDDNKDASVQMAEDEMSLFGKIDGVVRYLRQTGADSTPGPAGAASAPGQPNPKNSLLDIREVVRTLAARGGSNFPEELVLDVIKFRADLTEQIAAAFRLCQFHAVGGRVRVKCRDFGLVASLDRRGAWSKICVMMHQYTSPLDENSRGPAAIGDVTFSGRTEVVAGRLPAACVRELAQSCDFLLSVEKFVKRLLKHYVVPDGTGDTGKVLDARAAFFASVGKMVLRAGSLAADARQKAQASHLDLLPDARADMLAAIASDSFFRLEAAYVKKLLASSAFTETSLPERLYEKPSGGQDEAASSAERGAASKLPTTISLVSVDGDGNVVVTAADVLRRLGVETVGAYVMWHGEESDSVEEPVVKIEGAKLAAAGDAPEQPGAKFINPAGSRMGSRVKLLSVTPPAAVIEVVWTRPVPNEEGHERDPVREETLVKRVKVRADSLFPAKVDIKADTLTNRDISSWPADRALGALPPFCTDEFGAHVARSTASHALASMHASCLEWLSAVEILGFAAAGKLPYVFQARATKDLKKGELVLVPYSKCDEMFTSDDAKVQKLPAPGKVTHELLTTRASIVVRAGGKKKPGKTSQPPAATEHFVVPSPLLAGATQKARLTAAENLSPFWAVPKALDEATPNMGMDTVVVEMLLPKPLAGPKISSLQQAQKWSVEIPVMVNTKKLSKGDVLALPFFADAILPA